jgi:hypothetical protein
MSGINIKDVKLKFGETELTEIDGDKDCLLDSEVHEGSLLGEIVKVDIKDSERTAIDRLIEVSKELCQCKIFEEERYKFIKVKLQVSSGYFIKSQFNHDEEIFTVNAIAFPSSVEIRASQRKMESGDWIVHDFTIDAETKEVKHEIFEVANNEAALQFVKDGSIT